MIRVRLALLSLFAATAASAQVPPSPAAPETPPAPPAPSAPPTGDAAQIVSILDHFCVPAIGGGSADKLGRPLGLRKNRDGDFVMALAGAKKITVSPPNTSNPTVCTMSVLYDVDGEGPIYAALNNWALAHANPYVQARNHETSQVGDETHVTSTWSAVEADGAEGLVFIQERTSDGKPLSGRADQATILFSIRPS
jgi:hypothetical protein